MPANKPSQPKRKQALDFPAPDDEAKAHSLRMLQKIQTQIERAGGQISFEQYMQSALFLPELGYYRCGAQKFGAGGDFTTAPEVSPLFAQCLASFIQQIELPAQVLEVGAGSGTMAATILNALAQQQHDYTYYILELSAELRQRQRDTIMNIIPAALEHVEWLDSFPLNFSGVVLANELLDAMPVTRFHIREQQLFEQYVEMRAGLLGFKDVLATNSRLIERVECLKQHTRLAESENYLSEINFMAEDWIKSLAAHLESAVVLLIDYGYPRDAYYHAERNMGTLMCHFAHRAHADPLILPGIQDITAHIDFTAMADSALQADMQVCGFATQAHFLLNLGILDALAELQGDQLQYLQASSQVKQLTLPGEMGESFKVMALTKHYDQPIPGFQTNDIRHLL